MLQESGSGPIMREGEVWKAGPGMSLVRAEAGGSVGESSAGSSRENGEALPSQPVVVKLVTGKALNWLEALTF